MPVVDVIQTIELSRKSGVITRRAQSPHQAAALLQRWPGGRRRGGALRGEDAVYRLLTWSEGDFEVVFKHRAAPRGDPDELAGLLMEGMRRLDEWGRLLEQLPRYRTRFEVDAGELAAAARRVPDENNPLLRLIDGKRTLLR
jgi:hypothetical protein